MNRAQIGLAAIAIVAAVMGALLFQTWQAGSGNEAPVRRDAKLSLQNIPLFDLAGQRSTIGEWQGKILVVNFWAPWCAPCRREIPGLINLHEEFSQQSVAVLGIAFDGLKPVQDFVDDFKMSYPQFIANDGISMYSGAFGNRSGSLPFTAILDRELNIVYQHNGEVSEEQLRNRIEALL